VHSGKRVAFEGSYVDSRSDSELVRQALSGDYGAFGVVVSRHADALYGVALRRTRDVRQAQDLVQETLLEAFVNLDHLRDLARFRNWLFGIMRNLHRGRTGREHRMLSLEDLDQEARETLFAEREERGSGTRRPDEDFARKEICETVRACIRALPEKAREAITRFYLEGDSYRDLAESLGVSVGTIRSRLSYGRQKMRGALISMAIQENVMGPSKSDAAKVAAVVRKHTGQKPTSVEMVWSQECPWPWFYGHGDDQSSNYSVRCKEREYMVRIPDASVPWTVAGVGLPDEYHAVIGKYVLDALRERGLGAPIVYAVDRDCDILDRPCSIASRVPGRPWRYFEEMRHEDPDRPPERRKDAPASGAELGRFVKGIHDIRPVKGFGPVTDGGVGLLGSWPDWVGKFSQNCGKAALARGAISKAQFVAAADIIEKWSPLCHVDGGRILHMSDIMFAAMVDFGSQTVTGVPQATEACSGDPDYELEWFAYYDEDTGGLDYSADEFAQGYGRPYNERSDKRRFYRLSIYLCKFTWFDMSTSRAKHHLARFQELLSKLA